jgi:hypothetical protein
MAKVKKSFTDEIEAKKFVKELLDDTEGYLAKLDMRMVQGGYKVIATTYPVNNEA